MKTRLIGLLLLILLTGLIWRGHGSLNPPSVQSGKECILWQSTLDTPFCGAEGQSLEADNSIGSRVSVLGNIVCPSAVAGLVSAGIVNSINTRFVGSNSHIGEEVFKLSPSFANRYSTTAIIFEGSTFRVKTSPVHRDPRFVGSGSKHPMLCYGFSVFASATRSRSGNQIAPTNNSNCSAVASAIPKSSSANDSGMKRINSPMPERSSGKVFASPQVVSTILCSHDARSSKAGDWLEAESGYSPARPCLIVEGESA